MIGFYGNFFYHDIAVFPVISLFFSLFLSVNKCLAQNQNNILIVINCHFQIFAEIYEEKLSFLCGLVEGIIPFPTLDRVLYHHIT